MCIYRRSFTTPLACHQRCGVGIAHERKVCYAPTGEKQSDGGEEVTYIHTVIELSNCNVKEDYQSTLGAGKVKEKEQLS